MGQTLPAEFWIEGSRHWGEAVWIEPGRVHVLLHKRLPRDVECRLRLCGPDRPVKLFAKVLVVEATPCEGTGPSILHLCAVEVPPPAIREFDSLLRRVNPGTAPLQLPNEPVATPRRPARPEPPPQARPAKPRLTPQRRRPARVPKVVQPSNRGAVIRERRPPRRAGTAVGLRVEELVQAQVEDDRGRQLVARFDCPALWRRSARLGQDWLQLVVADSLDAPVGELLALTLVLPTGRACFLQVRLARRSRGRIILEASGLSEASYEELCRARHRRAG